MNERKKQVEEITTELNHAKKHLVSLKEDFTKIIDEDKKFKYESYIAEQIQRINMLTDDLDFLLYPPTYTNGEIDLYMRGRQYLGDNDKEIQFDIRLPNEIQTIGEVVIRYGKHNKMPYGNIGYNIKKGYRGHNYSLKALNILIDFMLENDMEKPIMTALTTNIPSNRLIQNFGAELIATLEDDNELYNVYEVDLRKNKNQMNRMNL